MHTRCRNRLFAAQIHDSPVAARVLVLAFRGLDDVGDLLIDQFFAVQQRISQRFDDMTVVVE